MHQALRARSHIGDYFGLDEVHAGIELDDRMRRLP
jgi:hypothetical protein